MDDSLVFQNDVIMGLLLNFMSSNAPFLFHCFLSWGEDDSSIFQKFEEMPSFLFFSFFFSFFVILFQRTYSAVCVIWQIYNMAIFLRPEEKVEQTVSQFFAVLFEQRNLKPAIFFLQWETSFPEWTFLDKSQPH